MNRFAVKILAAERVFYEGECESLVVPTLDGAYGIQARHQDVTIAVVPGTLHLRIGEGREEIAAVSEGLVRMENNEALVLVDTIERPEEIDLNRARREAEQAQEALLQQKSMQEFRIAKERMARAIGRIRTKGYQK